MCQLLPSPSHAHPPSIKSPLNISFCCTLQASSLLLSNKKKSKNKTLKHKITMASQQERSELDARARQGETVVPGGTGGKSLEAQEHLAEGRSRGGQTRREQLGTEGYQEMGRKGGLSTGEETGGEHEAREGVDVDESKYRTRSRT